MRIAMLSYRSKPHVGGQGIYIRRLSRELGAVEPPAASGAEGGE